MTGNDHRLHEIVFQKKEAPEDQRPFWLRLLKSIRVVLKPGKTFQRPVAYLGVKGEAEF